MQLPNEAHQVYYVKFIMFINIKWCNNKTNKSYCVLDFQSFTGQTTI